MVQKEGALNESFGGNYTQVPKKTHQMLRICKIENETERQAKRFKTCFSPKVVQDSVQELLLLVPQIKSNISDAIAMVPEVVFVSSSELLRSLSSNACNPFEHGSFFVGASRRRRTYKCDKCCAGEI